MSRTLTAFVLALGLAFIATESNRFTLEAANQLGAIHRLRVSVGASDVTDPTVSFSSPTSGASHDNGSSSTVDIAGSASDASGILSCTYSYDGGASQSLSGTTSWSGTVSLSVGTKDIVVTCTDGAGRTGFDTLSVTYTLSSGNNCNGACLFETSFTTAQGWEADKWQYGGSTPSNYCQTNHGSGASASGDFDGEQTGVGSWGGWQTVNQNCDEVITAANYSGGAGGRGFRHWRGETHNNNGGGIKFQWTATAEATDNLSVCQRVRYHTTMHWYGGAPSYVKEFNMSTAVPPGTGWAIVGVSFNSWALVISNTLTYAANLGSPKNTWTGTMGGNGGDATWHEFAWAGDIDATWFRMWMDDTLIYQNTSMPWASASPVFSGFQNFFGPSNQGTLDNDQDGIGDGDTMGTDSYTDYDDIVADTNVSNNGKLEC